MSPPPNIFSAALIVGSGIAGAAAIPSSGVDGTFTVGDGCVTSPSVPPSKASNLDSIVSNLPLSPPAKAPVTEPTAPPRALPVSYTHLRAHET